MLGSEENNMDRFNLYCDTVRKIIGLNFKYEAIDIGASQVAFNGREEPACNAGDIRDAGLIPGRENPLEGGHGNLCSIFLPLDRGYCFHSP